MAWLRSWQGLLAIAVLAFLALLERAYLDWRYVLVEAIPDDDTTAAGAVVAVYVALSAAWIWALVALARQRRGGAIALLLLSGVLLVALGILTPLAFLAHCPAGPPGRSWKSRTGPASQSASWPSWRGVVGSRPVTDRVQPCGGMEVNASMINTWVVMVHAE